MDYNKGCKLLAKTNKNPASGVLETGFCLEVNGFFELSV